MNNKKLQDKLFLKKESAWKNLKQEEVFKFCEDYKNFLRQSKTERQCVKNIIKILEENGFTKFNYELREGTKCYKVVKDKCVIACIVGENKTSFRLLGSHVDSPRLDLKPTPLYEDSNLALLQTHYYGGIKKYHWVNTPLILQGVVMLKDGKKVEISIGDKDYDPVFVIPDLLPHLAKEQMKKEGNKIVEGEELNVLFASIPINDEEIKEQIKFSVLKQVNEDYGMIEEDFVTAELEFVPAYVPRDVGLGKGMIGAYGQDDRVCVYTTLKAISEINDPKHTCIGLFVDKEEIGSMGDTGAQSLILRNFIYEYRMALGLTTDVSKIMEDSKALSADVTAGLNPNYKNVHDDKNVSYLGKGVSVEKYGGGGGKYSTHDAHAEFVQEIRTILDDNKIPWQTGELGKIDIGGGGTIAMFLSRYGMDCIDAGPCVLGMHSPFEITNKADVYCAYLLYKKFLIR
ncbi:aminopeptidase [Candidatus Woesearchaeota archaeon]|nr:aminopeptidase [Candidatus Woesearchaeota archaeon]